MTSECFVPNCKSSDGVPIPSDSGTKQKWLESLQITEAPPDSGGFVCVKHFQPSDVRDANATDPGGRVNEGAVPTIVTPQTEKCEEIVNGSGEKNEGKSEVSAHLQVTAVKMCRVCMTEKNIAKNIFEYIECDITIVSTLMLCAFPLEISKTDNLPKHICRTCLNTLIIAHRFRKKCLKADEILQNICNDPMVGTKRKADENSGEEPPKKIMYRKTDSDENGVTIKLEEVESKSVDDQIEKFMEEIHREAVSETPPDKIFLKSPQSLKSVLAMLEEGVTEPKRASKSPYVIKHVPKASSGAKNVVVTSTVGQKKTDATFESKIGNFACLDRASVLGNSFCVADGYLFEYGLVKNQVRHLKCIVPTCKSVAEQLQLMGELYENSVAVKVPHNHASFDDNSMKKQMFLNVLRKKMQTDRTLNIRHLYEEICEQEPILKSLIPLRNVINEICKHQLFQSFPHISSFEDFYNNIESHRFEKLHFTHGCQQFYQEKFATDDGAMAVTFGNRDVIQQVSSGKLMYVDASFKIENSENYTFQLVTVLVWVDNSYYPILFTLINRKTQELFKKVFKYLYDVLAPDLRPREIVTDYESNLYYALGETYVDSHIGGSVFYYTQNLYKKICSLNLSRDLETNSYFRNVYHMLLMLPLLPVNTIADGLNNIEVQARDLGLSDTMRPVFEHVRTVWMGNVTPDLFCVHRLENRINENVIAPFKKLRDFLLLTKGKLHKSQVTIGVVVEKLIELESFLQNVYSKPDKKSFGRDLSSFQKKNVLRAWQFIESHPKININNFFSKVLGYIKCMENQLWIWGFYRHVGDADEDLINASNFSIVSSDNSEAEEGESQSQAPVLEYVAAAAEMVLDGDTVVVEAVVERDGEVVLQNNENVVTTQVPEIPAEKHFESAFMKYVFP